MRWEEWEFLRSPEGQALLAELAAEPQGPDSHLAVATLLRKTLNAGQVAAILETVRLRQRASGKFDLAGKMYFTGSGLEQATHQTVAIHRARRFSNAGLSPVADLGCGIGSDSVALAALGATVVAVDLDWLHAHMTWANADIHGVSSRVLPVLADLTQISPLPVRAFFFDPARRTVSGPALAPSRRLKSVEAYHPPLGLIDGWRPQVPHGAVKVSPAIDYNEIPESTEAEFVSLAGEMKEAVLWYGDLRTDAGRRATLLPGGQTLTDREPGAKLTGPPRSYLYEPDSAVIRAHLVAQLDHQLDATFLDAQIAYLTTPTLTRTSFARGFQIEDYFPFQLKRLRHYLRDRHIGAVTIKKRGSPLDVDALRRALRLEGDDHRFIFLTQMMGQATVLIGQAVG